MSNLSCSVSSCQNNSVGLCCLSTIDVGGSSATSSSETSCRSYRPGGSTTNRVQNNDATPTTSISCKAANCKHNDQYHCIAGNVSIDHCSCDSEAGCRTFKE